MAQLVLNPTGYSSSNSSFQNVANITNAYNNTGSTTYASVSANTTTNTTSYISLLFNVSSIPSNATIDSISCVAKIGMSSTSTTRSNSRSIQLYNDSTAKGNSVSFNSNTTGVSATISSSNAGTWTRDELENIQLRISSTRGTSSNALAIRIYGANLTITYTENGTTYTVTINSTGNGTTNPVGTKYISEGDSLAISAIPDTGSIVRILDNSMTVTNLMNGNVYTLSNITEDHTIDITYIDVSTYQVNTTVNNGTLISPSESETVTEGSDVTIAFKGNADTVFKSMTVNGVAVTPSEIEITGNATYEISTNYGTYSTYALENAMDGDTSTYFWSNEAQATGKYILFTFSSPVALESFTSYSSNSGDYPHSTNYLQVSMNGEDWTDVSAFSDTQTNTFNNINQNCKYVRIYAKSDTSNWLVLNTVQMQYTTLPETALGYVISNVTENCNVIITYKEATDDYSILFKDSDNQWKQGAKLYQKRGNCWWEITRAELLQRLADNKFQRGADLTNHTNDEYLNGRTLLFEDDFDKGELDTTIWTSETGYCRNSSCVAYYTPEALSFEGSNLVITGSKATGLPNAQTSSNSWALTYKSGSIQSQDKFTFRYGRAQAKLKCPKLAGTWPAWWLFGNERKFAEYHTDGTILTESGVEWSECGEIDIIEQYGTANSYEWNLWQSQTGAGSSYRNGQYTLDPSEWHVYEVEWTPTTMNFMVDGVSVSGDIDITVSQGQAYRNYDFFMILNLQLGGTAGSVTADNIKMYIDWVRIYDYEHDYTISYNISDETKTNSHCAISASTTTTTTTTVKQGHGFTQILFPEFGYKFDSVEILQGTEDITATAYREINKQIVIDIVSDNITINTTTSPDTVGRTYVPLTDRPDNYSVLTINGDFEFSLNEYALNPGYNISSASTTVNVEFIMPDDFIFSTEEGPIVPEELDFSSGIESASSDDNFNGVINDSTIVGQYPMWNITNWNSNNYFVMTLPIDVVGNNIDDIKAWFAKNNIQIYYKSSEA